MLQLGTGKVWVDLASIEEAPPGTPVSEAPVVAAPTDLDFEQGAVGAEPSSWSWQRSRGGNVTISDHEPHGGAHCLEVDPQVAGVEQRIDATMWRGKKLHVSAALRSTTEASLIVVVQGNTRDDQKVFYEQKGIAVAPGQWRMADVTADVGPDAKIVEIVFSTRGETGKGWIDDVSITTEP